MVIPSRAGAEFSIRLYMLLSPVLPLAKIHGTINQGRKREVFPLTITPSGPFEKKFASCSQDLILGWCREKLYSSRMENVSARRHSKRCIELEAKIPPLLMLLGF